MTCIGAKSPRRRIPFGEIYAQPFQAGGGYLCALIIYGYSSG
jgi:hypothetical protein